MTVNCIEHDWVHFHPSVLLIYHDFSIFWFLSCDKFVVVDGISMIFTKFSQIKKKKEHEFLRIKMNLLLDYNTILPISMELNGWHVLLTILGIWFNFLIMLRVFTLLSYGFTCGFRIVRHSNELITRNQLWQFWIGESIFKDRWIIDIVKK